MESKRITQGVLHNPASDRRTTSGVFHVADVGLPAADDKKVVPLNAAKELLRIALNPPQEDMIFPFSSETDQQNVGFPYYFVQWFVRQWKVTLEKSRWK